MVKVMPLPKRPPMELRLRPNSEGGISWPYSWMIPGDFFYIQNALVEEAEALCKLYMSQYPSKRFVTKESDRIQGLTTIRRVA